MKAAVAFACAVAVIAACAFTKLGPSLGLGAIYLVVAVLP